MSFPDSVGKRGGKCLSSRVRLPAPRSGMMIGIIGQQPKSYRNSAQALVSCEKDQLSRLRSSVHRVEFLALMPAVPHHKRVEGID